MSKTITVEIKGNEMTMEFGGYPGRECFDEADKLKAKLKTLGLEIDTIKVIDRREEVEVRTLQNDVKVGA